MKKALIHDAEPGRICDVHPVGFPVAPTMQWIDCADDVTTGTHHVVGGKIELIPPPVVTWANIRRERNGLLASSDWRMLSAAQPNDAWRVYRQALRDIPQTFSDPAAVVWPEAPRE